MIDLGEPLAILALIWGTVIEAVFLLVLLRVFQPPPPEPGAPARPAAFLERFALLPAGIVCFVVLLALVVLSLALPGGALVAVAGWWIAALTLFGLTVRQALKANIALGLFSWALVAALGAAARSR